MVPTKSANSTLLSQNSNYALPVLFSLKYDQGGLPDKARRLSGFGLHQIGVDHG